jgi:mono/diheme cytochrome c family protein
MPQAGTGIAVFQATFTIGKSDLIHRKTRFCDALGIRFDAESLMRFSSSIHRAAQALAHHLHYRHWSRKTFPAVALLLSLLLHPAPARAQEAPLGPFFETNFPFFQTTVELAPTNLKAGAKGDVVVRGILLPLKGGITVLFDQELLRLASAWQTPEGKPPVSLLGMAQISYAEPHRKAGKDSPKPASQPFLTTSPLPGVGSAFEALTKDPRPFFSDFEHGRGPLPLEAGRFEGVQLLGDRALLHYRTQKTNIVEWHEAEGETLHRHLEVSPHTAPLWFDLGSAGTANWELKTAQTAEAPPLQVATQSKEVSLSLKDGHLVAILRPSATAQRFTVSYNAHGTPASRAPAGAPARERASQRWPQTLEGKSAVGAVQTNGLALDRIALPLENPWNRRVRPADIAFMSPDKGAVVTYDGDVWLLDGLADPTLNHIRWKRFASGLNEPLSIANVGGVLQINTRNGLVRLHDRAGQGEADWYENFSDVAVQTQGSRGFALDMAVGADGSTYVSQGGIGAEGVIKTAAESRPKASRFSGGVARISPDGKSAELISSRAREPYLALNPHTGMLTGTDQQGNFIPSSVCYLIRKGNDFGFGDEQPAHLTPPLVWIPHSEDNSSASQVWMDGPGMGALHGKLIHLSYGRGTPFLICPDLDAPTPQGAVIPLNLETDIPLLHARMHPSGSSFFAAGFQIYDSRTKTNWGLGRIRLSGQPLSTPVNAKSCKDGVLLTFESALDPQSVRQESTLAASWNYERSKKYGSNRLARLGQPGSDALPVGQVLLSTDQKTVFIHLPGLEPVMQLEVEYGFRLLNGTEAKGSVYFTIHQPHPCSLAEAGFPAADLSKSVPVVRVRERQTPTREQGLALSEKMGCIACHSANGTQEGKTGPTWKGLFGKDRYFTDGSMESANEYYIRTAILEPEKKIVNGYLPGMPSYKGVLDEDQVQSIILYIRSLQ